MFDIGFLELLIIGVVALLVLGPERLPKAARTAGLWIGRIKRTVSGMQREINAQLEAEELRQKLNEQQKKLDEGINRVKRDVERTVEDTDARDERPSAERREPSEASSEQRLDDATGTARRQADDSDAHEDASTR
ncbi:Sec-independent protein translocase protein TatB [Halomonas getboli]|uniref:Sec-independent protein translocase protein TatB n=1 Tax=Halomonas getboli TaxID=2935862 RepID=UPI001FFEF6EF|nr:Sec-independent protein translocase protein TatB [Halomonas getboli]MCK2184587.1 Sec-independent protein translocase protein TatB [Halomonas getboli]